MAEVDFFQVNIATIPVEVPVPFHIFASLTNGATQPFLQEGEVLNKLAALMLQSEGISNVWVQVADRPRYFHLIEGHFCRLMEGDAPPTRKTSLAVGIVRDLAAEIFSSDSLGALGKSLPILGTATRWFTEGGGPIPLPKLGRPHRLPNHALNVFLYALVLSRSLGDVPSREQNRVATGAFLHDMGMLGRFESIAERPGPLAPAEQVYIRQHTLRGTDQLTGGVYLEPEVTDVVRHHHEAMDGTGYPDGFSGDDISLGARIVAIGSVLSALTSETPRRPAFSLFEALKVMAREMPGKFDKALLKRFVESMSQAP